MEWQEVARACSKHLPAVVRWAGAVAKRLRHFDIAVTGKTSGSANTDALTLADLTLQELIVAALRDCDPIFQKCQLQAEESTGDIARFSDDSNLTITIDPIDGTKQYRDKTGNGYAMMVLLRSMETVHYSLVYTPESGEDGTWMEAIGDRVVCGPDDHSLPPNNVLQSLSPIEKTGRKNTGKIYLIGFQDEDRAKALAVTETGLEGVVSDDMPGSIYELQARGDFAGSLIHSPNIYDFPASLQISRAFGGEALWVHNREPVHFEELWMDDQADMLRLPGIVACSEHADVLDTLCELARDWNPVRYRD